MDTRSVGSIALALAVLLPAAGCGSGSDRPASADSADEAAAVEYQCERIDNNHSAAEAGESFRAALAKSSIVIRSTEIEDECEGEEVDTNGESPTGIDPFRAFEVGGSKCAADGYSARIENDLFKGVDRGVILIDANDSTDYYLCTREDAQSMTKMECDAVQLDIETCLSETDAAEGCLDPHDVETVLFPCCELLDGEADFWTDTCLHVGFGEE